MDHLEINTEDILVNTGVTAVSDSLLGLATLNPELEILNVGNVVLHKGLEQVDKVLVISGGASGLEPAFAHYVGKGMLAAAVQGDLLQSPPSRPILRTIRELAAISLRGVLIIVNGNSGDLLNFGLATERAKKELLRVMMLPIFDNYSNGDLPSCKRRGLSGIVLIMKIAGAMAEDGHSIDKIYKNCEMLTENLISISFGTREHLLRQRCVCKAVSEFVIGTNINGESALKRIRKSHVKEIVNSLMEELLYSNKKQPFLEIRTTPVVLLVNNVGGISKLEEMIIVKELIGHLDDKGVVVSRIYSGTFLGSMYFDGIIISLLRLVQPDILKYLDAPTTALGWKNVADFRTDIKVVERKQSILHKKPRTESIVIKGPKLTDHNAMKVKNSANFACEAIISCERQLNKIDSETGNSNTGTRMKTAAVLFLQKFRANKAHFDLPYHFFQYLSKLCEYHLGGPMGCIFCILFEAASGTFLPLEDLDDNLEGPIWLESLKNAVESLKRYTLAQLGDNTLLDPLEACVKGTVDHLFEMPSYLEAFRCGVAAAEQISAELKNMNLYPDPGSHAVVIILRAIYEGLKLS
ncbi:triokinase/FMN cyclase-like [Coccinella septempunctata]|uniref:triokinase/FMN cyclase-like n=1 Tax=Coccinella septempunctata TaxID=41139 RepID=UPI001D063283|nr:triokinase/FMN cyclase-like [Coccinella septempunctata]